MQFFTWEYWFGFPPFITTAMLVFLLALFGGLFVGGVVLSLAYEKITDRLWRQVARRAATFGWVMGVIGLVLIGARYERVPWFMYRYWLLLWGVGALAWLVRLERYIDRRREQLEEENKRYWLRDRFLQK